MTGLRISASLASAPLDQLGEVIGELEAAGVDMIHFDVEDGSFVPVMTLGTKIIGDLRPRTKLPFDVHLMMVHPEWIIPQLVESGADRVAVHYEACPYPKRTLGMIADAGAAAGIAFNPATPIPDLRFLAPDLSFVIVLTTEPEVADPAFIPSALAKVARGLNGEGLGGVEWVVDGGVTPANVEAIRAGGADTVVVGRSLFRGASVAANLQALRRAAASNPTDAG